MRTLDELERRFVVAIEADAARSTRPRRSRLRRWARPAGIAATLVAAAAVAVVLLLAGARDVVRPTAAQALEHAAQAAASSGPAPVLHAGEYWYVRARGTQQEEEPLFTPGAGRRRSVVSVTTSQPVIVETWVGTGREARARTLLRAPAKLVSAADRARWKQAGSPELFQQPSSDTIFTKVRGLPIGLGMLSYDQVRTLPTDPRALLAVIARAARHSSYARSAPHFGPALLTLAEFRTISGLLVAPVDRAVRAALFRATALVPGVRYLGTQADAIGRRGVAIGLDWRGSIMFTLIFDPHTSALLGISYPAGAGGGLAYVASGVARSIGATPAGIAPVPGPLPRVQYSNPPRKRP